MNEQETLRRLWKMFFPQFSETYGCALVKELLKKNGYKFYGQ